VLALCTDPELLKLTSHFPADSISRATALLHAMPGGTGTYSHSQGVEFIRKDVAKFIEERDGFPSDFDSIFLSNGASPAIQNVLNTLIRPSADPEKPTDGILIPIPQYPLYTASIALFGGAPVPYFLDEENAWSLSAADLTASVKKARENGITVRGLVIINPGNPTGQVLSIENMREIVDFCYREKIVLLADEVYQENVYGHKPFHSFKKVLRSMPADIAANQELFSFHSISKGFFGECGRRGGYVECVNIHPMVKDELYKLASISLCPNVDGQVTLDTMVRPPREGEPSYPVYKQQRDAILASLKRRALQVAAELNKLEGVRCNDAEGAMYLFPKITLPAKAVTAAKTVGKSPDLFYCLSLLNSTGLVVVPGSGFGQKEGTFHFRTTFLPPEDQIKSVLASLAKFHHNFMRQYQ
jgi:aspartate/methionine/tyrosine aminotransferase